MDSIILKVRRCIFKDENGRMELDLFRVLCLASTLISYLVIIPANSLNHLPPVINLYVALFGAASFFLFRQACRGRYQIRTLFFLFLGLTNLVWFPNGGSHGSVSFFFFCILLYVQIFFRGRSCWVLLSCAIGDWILLLVAEQFLPEWVVPFQSSYYRSADLVVGMTMTALCCFLMIWVLLRSYHDEQKRLVAMNEDLQMSIAERAQAEASLLQSRELLNAVIEGSTDAIFVKDIGGNYLLFNRGAEELTGKGVGEVLGRDDTFLFPPEVARRIRTIDRTILDSNEARIIENELITANGRSIISEAVKGPLHDSQGNIIGIFGISRDVTESRRTGEELRKLNEELERRVSERTARLESAMREQESFSYSVSHDLRGPLRHINSYAAILDEDFGTDLSEEARQYLDRIRNSSSRMGCLIDDLLELSRIARSELHKVPVGLSELASAILCKFREAEPGRRVELVVEPGLEAHGDRVLLG